MKIFVLGYPPSKHLYFLIISSNIFSVFNGTLSCTMDKKILLIVAVAFISGSYRNSYKLPAPFVGSLASALGTHKKELEYSVPYYVNSYKIFETGT